ncbi:hypothetical protein PoB_003401000 [Plakobranchus ocellatus]|uniref:Uncharacterized protein n=1 Tax=Plakobranchus ocellatus TaxID=259542 RepID=A0AAV4AJJ2_9GAST|nr:hypothetical protein PoB_003401000 [Plakobranchus ocellatus]
MPYSQDSDSETIIAGSSGSEFNLDLSSDKDGPNGVQIASALRSRTDFFISGRGTPATDQGVGDFQSVYSKRGCFEIALEASDLSNIKAPEAIDLSNIEAPEAIESSDIEAPWIPD